MQLSRDGSGRRPCLFRECECVQPLNLVPEEGMPLPFGKTFEGYGDGGPFLSRHQVVPRHFRRRQVDHTVLVAPVTILCLPHGGHHVARSDYRVRLQHAGLNSVSCGEYPHESLLHQVVDGGLVLHPCTDDAPYYRNQRSNGVACV